MDELKHAKGVKLDTELTTDDLKELVRRFKKAVKERTGKDFPEDAYDQMWGAIGAVFGSWMNDRAIVYRRQYGIPARMGHGGQHLLDGVRQHGRRLRAPASPSRATRPRATRSSTANT